MFQGLFLMYIDVYKFLIRIFAIGGRASLLCVYFDALIFKGKSMLRWQEGFYLYKVGGDSKNSNRVSFPTVVLRCPGQRYARHI